MGGAFLVLALKISTGTPLVLGKLGHLVTLKRREVKTHLEELWSLEQHVDKPLARHPSQASTRTVEDGPDPDVQSEG